MRDRRYGVIRSMVLDGKIHIFSDIIKYVPKSIIAKDLGTKNARMTALFSDVTLFKLGELFKIGAMCELSEKQVLNLVHREILMRKKEKFSKNGDKLSNENMDGKDSQ